MDLDDNELTGRFSAVGRRYSYDDVMAQFAAFRDFKIRWTRNYHWASFEVSDYLMDAPPEVITQMAETLFRRIEGEKEGYPPEVGAWLSSPDFVRAKQPLYIQRYIGLSRTPRGRHRDLSESYGRLVDAGLLTEDPDMFLGWSMPGRSRCVGRASVLMKVVSISGLLDTPDVPEEILDYCLYSQAAHVRLGFNPTGTRRGREYEDLLSMYPRRAELEAELRRMSLHI